jgi:general stress protein YciG
MSGNYEGGIKAAKKNKENDPDHYRRIGKLGGSKSRGGGFADKEIGIDGLTGQERAIIVGRKGGMAHRTKWKKNKKSESAEL